MAAREETALKRIMESEGRSQAWLARRLGVKRQQVWTWSNGIHCPEQATREQIANALRLPVEQVFPPEPEAARAA